MKYIPCRKCIACQSTHPKNEMLRIAKSKNGSFTLDETQKSGGRGAYVCKNQTCIDNAVKKKTFHRSFKTKVPQECYEILTALQKED